MGRIIFPVVIKLFIQDHGGVNKLKSIQSLMHQPRSSLGKIHHHADGLQRFERRYRALLKNTLSTSLLWQVGNLDHTTLTLVIENAGWATRLRFMQQELLRVAQRIDPKIVQIKLQVRRPIHTSKPPTPSHVRQISPQCASQLQAFAECVADPKLKQALQRLAAHAKQ